MLPDFLNTLPYSTLFVFLLAGLIALLTSSINRKLTDPKKSKAQRKEISEWSKELRKAQKSKDQKTVEKLMKKQKNILSLQSKMMWQSTKVMLLTFVPLILMWQFLGGFYTSPDGQPITVAYFPGVGPIIPLPILGNMVSLYWLYLLSSFLLSTTFSRLFGLVE